MGSRSFPISLLSASCVSLALITVSAAAREEGTIQRICRKAGFAANGAVVGRRKLSARLSVGRRDDVKGACTGRTARDSGPLW